MYHVIKHTQPKTEAYPKGYFYRMEDISNKDFKEKYQKSKPHRPREAEKIFGKRVRVYELKPSRFYYCFVKGFNTGAGRSREWHWVETSVDVWCEFVVEVPEGESIEVWEEKYLPSDKVMIQNIETFLFGHKDHSWIMSLDQKKHVWGVEREEKPDELVTWPDGMISAWTMPNYERRLIYKEKIENLG